ncbi:hypothetical protein ABZY34_16060, partial [Streptomyces virginiae]|uniref:hypothetical protein n=1 Tax=Streptomyces virginiae TaxID=1961 RepID=UPI0033B85ED9
PLASGRSEAQVRYAARLPLASGRAGFGGSGTHLGRARYAARLSVACGRDRDRGRHRAGLLRACGWGGARGGLVGGRACG